MADVQPFSDLALGQATWPLAELSLRFASPLSGLCLTFVSPFFGSSLTFLSPLSDLCPTLVSPFSGCCLTFLSPLFDPCPTLVSPFSGCCLTFLRPLSDVSVTARLLKCSHFTQLSPHHQPPSLPNTKAPHPCVLQQRRGSFTSTASKGSEGHPCTCADAGTPPWLAAALRRVPPPRW